MSLKRLLGGATWLGAGAAVVVLLGSLGVGALLLARGVVPEGGMRPMVWLSAGLACFCGGRVAVRRGGGDGTLPRALAVSGCVYGGIWLAVLAGNAPVCFDGNAWILAAAVWGGGAAAGLMGRRKRRKRAKSPGKSPVRRRKRAVT